LSSSTRRRRAMEASESFAPLATDVNNVDTCYLTG
jgi:hypothetical protein